MISERHSTLARSTLHITNDNEVLLKGSCRIRLGLFDPFPEIGSSQASDLKIVCKSPSTARSSLLIVLVFLSQDFYMVKEP